MTAETTGTEAAPTTTTPPCKIVTAAEVSRSYRNEVKEMVARSTAATANQTRPKLVAFLANDDPAAIKYAQWSATTCRESGIDFELRQVARTDLEERIMEANLDASVHGIMVYYPVFGDPQVSSG